MKVPAIAAVTPDIPLLLQNLEALGDGRVADAQGLRRPAKGGVPSRLTARWR